MSERTVKLSDLVKPDADARTSKETVGLYEITTTSRPIELPRPAPGESIAVTDDPLPRVRQWLDDIFAAIGAIRAEPNKYSQSARQSAERCSVWATQLMIGMRELSETGSHSAGYVAQMMERSAELADEWHMLQVNAQLEEPVKRHRSSAEAGRANVRQSNAIKQQERNKKALDAVQAWRDDPLRRSNLAALSPVEAVHRYLKLARPPRRQADRLRAMLKAGAINK